MLKQHAQRLLVEHVGALHAARGALRRSHPFEESTWVVLPNHLHASWALPDDDHDFATRWMMVRQSFSRHLRAGERISDPRRRRDEPDLCNHIDDIHLNPVRQGLVSRVEHWSHSSFHGHVRDGRLPQDGAA